MIAFILEILFFGFCGWLGHVAVKILTFGRVNLDYGDSSESVITEWIGVGVLLAIAMLISFLINASRDQSSGMRMPTGEPTRWIAILDNCHSQNSPQTAQQTWRTRRSTTTA